MGQEWRTCDADDPDQVEWLYRLGCAGVNLEIIAARSDDDAGSGDGRLWWRRFDIGTPQ